jgi:Mg-chelatase subunit ChlD
MLRTVLLLGLLAGTAHADDDGLDEDGVHEVEPYWIHGSLDNITAKLGLRFHLPVGAKRGNQFRLARPEDGVVTGATLTVDGVPHHLALDATEHAAAQFVALTSEPDGTHRRWVAEIALGSMAGLDITIAAPRSATVTLDLEIDAPTCFHRDMRYVGMPETWRGSIDHSLAVISAEESPCSHTSTEDRRAYIAFPTSRASSQPFGEQRIVANAMRVDTEHGHFSRIEVDLAAKVSHVPEDLFTVFVIDASRSMAGTDLDAQAEVIKSYVANAPHSQVQVIAYARKARPLLPGWTPASHAAARIDRELDQLATENGSNVDAGLVEASKWLADVKGTRRIVVLTDQRLSDRVAGIPVETLRDTLPKRTLAHVVAVDNSTRIEPATLLRADDIAFAQLAIGSEGMAMQATGLGPIDALSLVRPIAFEQVKVHGAEKTLDLEGVKCEQDGAGDLVEGDACVLWGDGTVDAFHVEGLLWNHKVSRTFAATPQPQVLARMLTGLDGTFGDAQIEVEIENLARAVNREWSLFGSWGGASGYGSEDEPLGYGAFGCGCSGGSHDIGLGVGSIGTIRKQGSIADQISRSIAKCHVVKPVKISLELTLEEIVDVTVTSDPADRDCVTEAVWATPLAIAKPVAHEYTEVKL